MAFAQVRQSQQRPSTPEEKQLQQLMAKESKQVPLVKLGILLLLFAGICHKPALLLCCAVLCCAVLCCAVLCCSVLCCDVM